MVRDLMMRTYDRLVLRRPWVVLALLALLVGGAATQLDRIEIDASADSLMLQGDPALEFYREVSAEYDSEDFLLITWQPRAPLLSPESLLPLRDLVIFPRMVSPIFVGREASLLAVEEAQHKGLTIIGLTQTDPDQDKSNLCKG